ncbi:S8 family peptidase [Sphaerisporangium perillae]|uniref:S8 family peptidase n=1 Tax=Sphaerisporangium perillae TaxID=2935860 RepID=UPI00200D53F0|nr:S8 family serine peptidase [Sphaerisporangium perillae]
MVAITVTAGLSPTSVATAAIPTVPISAALEAKAAQAPVRVIVAIKKNRQQAVLRAADKPAAATVDHLASIKVPMPLLDLSVNKAALDALKRSPDVKWIIEDRRNKPSLASSTKVIGADKAHAAGRTGAGQAVAILDTGVDTDHPFLKDRIVAQACFSTPLSILDEQPLCPNDLPVQTGPGAADVVNDNCVVGGQNLCAHGTHVAGIAAGKNVAGAPGDGVAPDAAIVAVQVFTRGNTPDFCGGQPGSCVYAYDWDILTGLSYVQSLATAQHLPIAAANLSLGIPGTFIDTPCDQILDENGDPMVSPYKTVIDGLRTAGVATVVAAGNDGSESGVNWPGCTSSAVTVGATADDDTVAGFSNRGKLLDLFAPGVDIDSSVPDDAYAAFSGTSMATPHVAGAFAVLKAAYPGASVATLESKLKSTGKKITYPSDGAEVTTPRIDLFAALPPAPTPTPSATPSATPSSSPSTTASPAPTPKVTQAPIRTYVPTPSPNWGNAPTYTAPSCGRGHATIAYTVGQWAAELKAGKGRLSDARLACYLEIAADGSRVFNEKVDISTIKKAYALLAGKHSDLDKQLLAAWLNYANGAYNAAGKVTKKITFATAIKIVENDRLRGGVPSAKLAKDASFLKRYVNNGKRRGSGDKR